MEKDIQIAINGCVATLMIDRPNQMNALRTQTLDDLEAALDALAKNDEVRCLLITGAGQKAFVGGADIAEMADMNHAQALAFSEKGHRIMDAIASFPCPVVAMVNGYALGGGCELALACDIIFASERAVFALPEVGLGILPGFGGTQRLQKRLGVGQTKRLVFSGCFVKAAEALDIGLCEAVYPVESLEAECKAFAQTLAEKPPGAIRNAKLAIRAGCDDISEGLERERQLFASCFDGTEPTTHMNSFMKRK